MKYLSIIFSMLLALSSWTTNGAADEVYRETFGFCGEYGSAAAALNTNWQALRVGKTLGTPGWLKVFGPGAPKPRISINANPQGPSEGHAFWSKPTRSMLFITDEYPINVRDLYRVSYQQRLDAKIGGRPIDESKLALLIGDTWYIADRGHRQHHVGFWEPARFHPYEMTYGTSRHVPGHGISRPENSNVLLPASGVVTHIGIYFKKIRGKVRFDNFTIEDFRHSGVPAKADIIPYHCQFTSALPRSCKTSRFDNAQYFAKKKVQRKILRKIRGNGAKATRDKALISLLISSTLQSKQAANVQLKDYIATSTEPASLHVQSEPHSPFLVPAITEQLLNRYLAVAAETLVSNGPIFLDYSKRDKEYLPQRMCPIEVHRTLRRRAKRARVWEHIRIRRNRSA